MGAEAIMTRDQMVAWFILQGYEPMVYKDKYNDAISYALRPQERSANAIMWEVKNTKGLDVVRFSSGDWWTDQDFHDTWDTWSLDMLSKAMRIAIGENDG